MRPSVKKILVLALLSFLAAISISYYEKTAYPLALRDEIRIAPAREISELLSLDHRGFLADLYFIKVSLHSGSLMWKPLEIAFDYKWSYAMMDVITDLDPKYYVAYLFTGMGLIHRFDDVKLARPIMEKGMAVFPDSWELPFWIGYDHYVYLEDVETASAFLWQAFQKTDAPRRFLSLMLSALKKNGDYEKAFIAMQVLYNEAKDEKLKMVYAKKLIQLKNLAMLQEAGRRYEQDVGRPPSDLKDLITAGYIREMPEDPLGSQYEWNQEKKMVTVKAKKKKAKNT